MKVSFYFAVITSGALQTPGSPAFGGGVSQSVLSPVVLTAIVFAGLLMCVMPRNKAFIPLIVAAILVPTDQVLLVGAAHFPMLRILILFGILRMLWTKFSGRAEILTAGINGMDKAVIFFSLFTFVDGMLLWRQTGELIFQLGEVYTTCGVYFLFRFLVRDEDDVKRMLRALACVAFVVAAIMIYEQLTGKNPLYAQLGGARAAMYGSVMDRDDHFRATGPFGHPILAGTFGGIMFPLFLGLWWKEKADRKYAVAGMASTAVIPFLASSSTALFGFLGALIGLLFWPLRRQMRAVRWTIVIVLVSLHVVMKAPVWHLISRVDLTGSSSGYHRFQLVNQCILHFWDWMLVGTKSYGLWGWDMWDLSNQYVYVADTAGLIPLISFLAIIVYGFKYSGRARQAAGEDRKQEMFMWAFGASLLANLVAFWGISYFDQTIVVWYAILSMICAATAYARKPQSEPAVGFALRKPGLVLRPELAASAARRRLS